MKLQNYGFTWSVGESSFGNWYAVNKKSGEKVPCCDENHAIETMHKLHDNDSKSPF
jgi:hypothetical protein